MVGLLSAPDYCLRIPKQILTFCIDLTSFLLRMFCRNEYETCIAIPISPFICALHADSGFS